MVEPDDITLLRKYAEEHSDAAFAALTERHVNLVYSAALRRIGSPHAAEEITQAVFILLAKKAKSLGGKTVLSGWLYHTAQLTAANFLRGEIRRQHREQEAHMQSILNEPPVGETWTQIAPLLEDAMAKLGERDRDALVLRFFENKNLREVGVAIGTNEDAAKMRVNRALEKLRKMLGKHGVHSTTAVIAGAVSTHSIHAAPLGLAKTISAVAIAREVVAGSSSTMTLVKGVLKVMAWTKAKTVTVVGVGVLLAAGTTTVVVKEIRQKVEAKAAAEDESWRVRYFDSRALDRARPQVKILPAKGSSGGYGSSGNASMGIGSSVDKIILAAYQQSSSRTVFPPDMPAGNYDFIAKLPPGSPPQAASAALQAEVKKKFGLVGHLETRDSDVLILTAQNQSRPGLKPPAQQGGSSFSSRVGEVKIENRPVGAVANYLEGTLQKPVIDRTDITGNYDVTLKWSEKDWNHRNPEGLKQALADQLGFNLVPSHEPIEVLVVEKVN